MHKAAFTSLNLAPTPTDHGIVEIIDKENGEYEIVFSTGFIEAKVAHVEKASLHTS